MTEFKKRIEIDELPKEVDSNVPTSTSSNQPKRNVNKPSNKFAVCIGEFFTSNEY